MKKRRIFLWMGLTVLFAFFLLCQVGLAAEQYKVKRGDSLAKISQKFHVSIQDLRDANHLQGNALKPGELLVIPASSRASASKPPKKLAGAKGGADPAKAVKTWYYTVRKGDNVYSIANKTGVSISEIKHLNHLRSNRLHIGQKLTLAPQGPEPLKEVAAAMAGIDSGDLAGELEDDLSSSAFDETNLADGETDQNSGSDLLGKWNSLPERQLLVKVTKGFIGAPYRLGGSSVSGIDCSGFVKKIYQIFDIILPRTASEQSRIGKDVSRGELEAGDLVFFHTRRSIGHVGIYIGNNEFVHASSGRARKVKIDSLYEPYYNKRYVKAVRLKGLDEGM